jgi:hypothetical protein
MSTRERICAIEIEEDALRLTTLRTAEEVRSQSELSAPALPKPHAQMLAIAEKIVAQQSGDFDPAEFVDRYEDALRELIEEKKKGHVIKAPKPANDDGKVIDLMAALQRSLKAGGAAPQRERQPTAASRRREPAARAPRSQNRGGAVEAPADGYPAAASRLLAAQCDLVGPRDELVQLRRDKLDAKVEIREVLEKYARRHDVEFDEVTKVVQGYVDDLVNDLFFEREDELLDGIIEPPENEA